jgi:protein-L-isoaspartate(D-aspartate) O-methyltransferase
MSDGNGFSEARERMVALQLCERDIVDPRVLEAMRTVPRHLFVPPELRHLAYADGPLPIGHRQTISQPYIVALMVQLCAIAPEHTVLEIGAGSGYQAAILAQLACQVYTIERIPELARQARESLDQCRVRNVEVIEGDGTRGLPEHAPYHAIVVAAAAPRVPVPLQEQLAEGGALVVPVGGREGQVLERWIRHGEDLSRERLAAVAFVPLVGTEGWSGADPEGLW